MLLERLISDGSWRWSTLLSWATSSQLGILLVLEVDVGVGLENLLLCLDDAFPDFAYPLLYATALPRDPWLNRA